jgi:GNAT superfamily N-acetyltransferase
MKNCDITLRPLSVSEHALALDLWGTVFSVERAYFERYYLADPWYRPGDTLGGFADNKALVSAVHICRRQLAVSPMRSLFCGGIANVATLPEYRNIGISHKLLTSATKFMEDQKMQFSLLSTSVPNHYAALGWEAVPLPYCELKSSEFHIEILQKESTGYDMVALQELYAAGARPYQLIRTPSYFDNWVQREWRKPGCRVVAIPGKGYAVLAINTKGNTVEAALIEMRAIDADVERHLIANVLSNVNSAEIIEFSALPQFCKLSELPGANLRFRSGAMVRNIGMSAESYRAAIDSFTSGDAVWWGSDHF